MSKITWQNEILLPARARVYLLWAVLVTIGFVGTHLHQSRQVNPAWLLLSAVGLIYMWRAMPMQVRQMKLIFAAWLMPITVGMVVSIAVFMIDAAWTGDLIANLGGFWLIVMAVGYIWNGLVDPPGGWYYFAGLLNFAAGLLCFYSADWQSVQYLVAAIVSAWSMVNLWLFRT